MVNRLKEFDDKYNSIPKLIGIIEDKYVESIKGKPRIHSFSLREITTRNNPKIAFIRVPKSSFDIEPIALTKGHIVTVVAQEFTKLEIECSEEGLYQCSLHALANHTVDNFYDTSKEVEYPISWNDME